MCLSLLPPTPAPSIKKETNATLVLNRFFADAFSVLSIRQMAALSNHSIADSIISQKPTTTNTISSASRSESSHHRQHTISSAATPRSSVDHRPTDQLLHLGHASRRSHHAASASTSSLPRIASQRSSGGILSRAKDRTQSAFASISEPVLRPRQSNPGLARFTHGESLAPANRASAAATTASPPSKNPSSDSLSSGEYTVAGRNPPSQAYVDTDASHPLPIRQTRGEPKMHQTSSRLLRMTDDDRPYTRVRTFLLIKLVSFSLLLPELPM